MTVCNVKWVTWSDKPAENHQWTGLVFRPAAFMFWLGLIPLMCVNSSCNRQLFAAAFVGENNFSRPTQHKTVQTSSSNKGYIHSNSCFDCTLSSLSALSNEYKPRLRPCLAASLFFGLSVIMTKL